MKTILITGGFGFLGGHLVKRLNSSYNLIILELDQVLLSKRKEMLSNVKYYNTSQLDKVFRENQVNYIIHAATYYGRIKESSIEIIKTNILLPLQIIQLALANSTEIFINTDSFFSKPEYSYSFLKEYTLSKKQINEWLQLLSGRIKIVNMCLQHIYGPNDSPDKFIPQMIRSLIGNQDVFLSPGEQKRDFIFIDDVVTAFHTILQKSSRIKSTFTTFDIGTGQTTSIKDFLTILKKIANSKSCLHFGHIPYREGEIMDPKTDISMMKKLGWGPKHSLEDGILLTLEANY